MAVSDIHDDAAEASRSRGGFAPLWGAVFVALICAAPLIAVAIVAVTGPWTDYFGHIAGTRLPVWLANTAIVGVIAVAAAGSIGSASAWTVARYAFPGRRAFEWLLALPLAMPAYAAAYGWYDLTQSTGPLGGLVPVVRGPVGAGFIFAFTLYPYVYLLAREAFASQSSEAYDAARTLGCGPIEAFQRAALPMARPAIAAGLALVVMESLADFGAVVHLGAPTLSVGIIRAWAGEGSVADAARLALVLVSLAFLIFFIERFQRRRARQAAASGRKRPPRRVQLSPVRSALAIGLLSLPLMAGLIIPMGRLGWLATHSAVGRDLGAALWHSVQLAAISGGVAAILGVIAAYALRTRRLPAVLAARLAGLGYAVPGAVAAVGVLALFGWTQDGMDAVWTRLFGMPLPVLLSGGILGLIFAYQSRFAAAAIGPAESALARITPTLDGAARTLGAGPVEVAIRVHWPLIRSGALLAGLLVFVEVLKELPATMILRPFNFDTLAVTAHNYASDERLGMAALPALLIALAALGPMIWIARQMTRSERLVRKEAE
ncbi:iron ABC transporter permease [Marinicauda pacifica]|uniref:Iron ABC transporter permease n=1 Tax=Marinicauda pacifica TaxID=1133559 RepID=A0A4S2HE11_9PROT|nr:iron ABC transporter permease [Marinicauda pacifica]TGY94287.1 iron ABC transporter permease [Marinicauda pacifica]GGE34598.1 iron ABC transporter permease [Marinicauda pacifica]